MANGQQKGKENIEAFQQWTTTMRLEDYEKLKYRGKLNRVRVAELVGCGKSALDQNPDLRELLEKLEDRLRAEGILPPLVDETKQAKSGTSETEQHDQTARQRDRNAERINELEQRIVELEAENQALRLKQSRLSEVNQVLAETGYLL